jgi:superfamily II DNA or RNA helicase
MKPRPYQVEAYQKIREWWDGGEQNCFVVLATGLGKALRDDQKVLTPGGWVAIGSLKVGDLVIGSNGLPTVVLGVYPQGLRKMFRVEASDGASVICDGEHVWTVRQSIEASNGTPWRNLTTQELIDEGVPRSGFSRWELPVIQPSEAHCSTPCSIADPESCARSVQVRLPDGWRGWPVSDRRSLMSGMASRANETGGIILPNVGLALEVQELARGLGLGARIAFQRNSGGRRLRHAAWSICISNRRRISSIAPAGVGEGVCIKVAAEDGLFVTDGYIMTHNTELFIMTSREMRKQGLQRTLILAHRKELVEQAAKKYILRDPGESIGIFMGAKQDVHAAIICASVDSCYPDVYRDVPCLACVLKMDDDGKAPKKGTGCAACNQTGVISEFVRKGRLDKLPLAEIDLIIIDEAHHVTPDSRYMQVIKAVREVNPRCVVLLVTATPFRQDRKGFGWLVGGVAYTMWINDGIAQGWLAPFSPHSCRVELDIKLDDVRVSKITGDFVEGDLGKAIDTDDARKEVVKGWMANAGPGSEAGGPWGRRTVAFAASVDAAQHLADEFEAAGITASWICSDQKRVSASERERRLEAYHQGKIQVMINVGCLTEGWDDPETDCILLVRPTKSRGLYMQMVGRGTRLAPNKQDCLVIDCVGATSQGLRSMADLSMPVSKEQILNGIDEPEAEEEKPNRLAFDFPDEPTSVEINGHTTYLIDVFSGRVVWVSTNGCRTACMSPVSAVIVFEQSKGRFSTCASSRSGLKWLARDVDEAEALRVAETHAVEFGSSQWLNPGTHMLRRPLSTSQAATIKRLIRENEAAARFVRSDRPVGISYEKVPHLTAAQATAWACYLQTRLAFAKEAAALARAKEVAAQVA